MTRRQFSLVWGGVPLLRASEPPRIRLVPDGEAGEPMVISGRVYKRDGRTPAPGTRLQFYQTDAAGNYSAQQGEPRAMARLKATLAAGPNGEYEITTIRPGAYPGGGTPAHIHVVVLGREDYYLPDYLFEGDPYLNPANAARHRTSDAFSAVLRLSRDGRVWRATRDLRLRD